MSIKNCVFEEKGEGWEEGEEGGGRRRVEEEKDAALLALIAFFFLQASALAFLISLVFFQSS